MLLRSIFVCNKAFLWGKNTDWLGLAPSGWAYALLPGPPMAVPLPGHVIRA